MVATLVVAANGGDIGVGGGGGGGISDDSGGEAGHYICDSRAGRTFRPMSCESAMFFCAFSGCFVECVRLVVLYV